MHITSRRTCLAVTLGLFASVAQAAVLNVDIERPADPTHVGADGVLPSGTFWNGVLFDTDASNLLDSNRNTTTVGLTYLRPGINAPTDFVDAASTNDLQDSGMSGEGFEITHLDPDSVYALIVYAGPNSGFGITDAGGAQGGFCNVAGAPTYGLPGVVGRDFCRFDGLRPFDLGSAVFGLRLASVDGAITGLQLRGALSVSPGNTGDCSDLLSFFDDAVAAGDLPGSGPGNSAAGRRNALRNRIVDACDLLDRGQVQDACAELRSALRRTDGDPQQPDFVTGSAAPVLAARIRALRSSHSCVNKATWGQETRGLKPIEKRGWGLLKSRYKD